MVKKNTISKTIQCHIQSCLQITSDQVFHLFLLFPLILLFPLFLLFVRFLPFLPFFPFLLFLLFLPFLLFLLFHILVKLVSHGRIKCCPARIDLLLKFVLPGLIWKTGEGVRRKALTASPSGSTLPSGPSSTSS